MHGTLLSILPRELQDYIYDLVKKSKFKDCMRELLFECDTLTYPYNGFMTMRFMKTLYMKKVAEILSFVNFCIIRGIHFHNISNKVYNWIYSINILRQGNWTPLLLSRRGYKLLVLFNEAKNNHKILMPPSAFKNHGEFLLITKKYTNDYINEFIINLDYQELISLNKLLQIDNYSSEE